MELVTRFQAELDSYAVVSLASHVAGDDEDLRHKTLLKMAENRAASGDTEALELLKAAGMTDREISEANLLPAVVDHRIPTAQARGGRHSVRHGAPGLIGIRFGFYRW